MLEIKQKTHKIRDCNLKIKKEKCQWPEEEFKEGKGSCGLNKRLIKRKRKCLLQTQCDSFWKNSRRKFAFNLFIICKG